MFDVLLAAYDGSAPAHAGTMLAAQCAARWHAKMVLCYALDLQRLLVPAVGVAGAAPDLLDLARREAADLIVDPLRECRAAGVDCESVLRDEPALDGILAAAAQSQADLILIGTHGRCGVERVVLGSVAEDVLRHATVPVLVARAAPRTAGAFKEIVVAIDASPCSERALELAQEIAHADRSTLRLLHVDAPGDSAAHRENQGRALELALERVRFQHPAARAYHELAHDAGATIAEFAQRAGAQLVIAGSHGRKGLVRAVLGSVAETTVRSSPCPVLIAK